MSPVSEYDAKIDTKKRLTLRGAKYDHYRVKEFKDGHIVLEPRVLVKPLEVSRRTLKMMDSSMANLKRGIIGPAVDAKTLRHRPG